MIYPPTGTHGPEADQQSRRDPDRQLALMLVVLAVATALLFYAAELGPSSFARWLGIDRVLNERFGRGTGVVTETLGADLTPSPDPYTENPDLIATTPALFPTRTPLRMVPTVAIATQPPPQKLNQPSPSPLTGEGWPAAETATPGAVRSATPGDGSGYPGLAPRPTSGYPSPSNPSPSPDASGRSTPTASPGEA